MVACALLPASSRDDACCLAAALCNKITDDGLNVLAEKFPKLTDLDLNGCDKITDDAWQVLAEKCLVLRKLGLDCCDKLHAARCD
eukprot:4732566-Amphidinium_carterae.1